MLKSSPVGSDSGMWLLTEQPRAEGETEERLLRKAADCRLGCFQ